MPIRLNYYKIKLDLWWVMTEHIIESRLEGDNALVPCRRCAQSAFRLKKFTLRKFLF